MNTTNSALGVLPAEPCRGEVYIIGRKTSQEQDDSKTDNAELIAIVSNDRFNRLCKTVMAVPLTTIEGSDDLYTSITVPPGAGRIKEMRFALCNRITVIDKESLINRVGILPIQVTDEILKQLREILVL